MGKLSRGSIIFSWSANKRIFHRAFQLFCFLLICSSLGEQFSAVKRNNSFKVSICGICLKCVALGKVLHILNLVSQWLSDKEFTCQFRKCKRRRFDLCVGKIPWRTKWQSRQYSCLENSIGSGDWWATVHGAAKESDMTDLPKCRRQIINSNSL